MLNPNRRQPRISLAVLLSLFALRGVPATAAPPEGNIPPEFFGLTQNHLMGCNKAPFDYPIFDVPAGTFRIWDTCNAQWAGMNPSAGVYDFQDLDTLLADLKGRDAGSVIITLGRTPNWISSDPTDMECDYAGMYGDPGGECHPPSDLTPDGKGSDAAWRTFVTALLRHVTDPAYAGGHARIGTYEIWNEFHRSDTVGFATCHLATSDEGSCSYRGTFAQMLRMTQDLRCIAHGDPTEPITATGKTCGTAGYGAIGLDPGALIAEGNAGPGNLDQARRTVQNYLYCNANPPPGSECNYGDAGSAAVDAIIGHPYFVNGQLPELVMSNISSLKAVLSPYDAAKPYFGDEGSWGKNSTVPDPRLQAGELARWFMALYMSGAQRGDWYAWDQSMDAGTGGLWSPFMQTLPPKSTECIVPGDNGGFDCTGAISYKQVVSWLSDATVVGYVCPGGCDQPIPGVFTFDISRADGYRGRIAWDSSVGAPCGNVQCGSTRILPPPYTTQWRDLAGGLHKGLPATIGAAPILMEGFVPTRDGGSGGSGGGGPVDAGRDTGLSADNSHLEVPPPSGCGCGSTSDVVSLALLACAAALALRPRRRPGALLEGQVKLP